eukprot:GFYU01011255.1.p1 GENE.GFYU01011255.1~~GFYU01011255.1.p1  ORF type:complete len:362 (-),score=111.94 GFYU01011255.1:255-1310(-)
MVLANVLNRSSSSASDVLDDHNTIGWVSKVDLPDHEGVTALHLACKNPFNKLLVKLITKYGADPHRRDNKGRTPLHYACSFGRGDHVSYLISKHHADPMAADWEGKSALHHACEGGAPDIVKVLLKKYNADATVLDTEEVSPLHLACQKFQLVDIPKFMVSKHRGNPHAKDKSGQTPLHYAARGGSEAIVKYLVDTLKVDVNTQDKDGRTALHYAAPHKIVVPYLVKKGADVNIVDNEGKTALHHVANVDTGDYFDWSILMGRAGPNAVDAEGRTALHYATIQRRTVLVKFLMKAGAKADMLDHNLQSPLHLASADGADHSIALLLLKTYEKKKAHMNATPDQKSLLHFKV